MIMNLTVKVERQCLLICVLIMIIMLEIHILKFVLFNKILQVNHFIMRKITFERHSYHSF